MDKILHIVHCIDTEGPLTESLTATFQRLKQVFGVDIRPTQSNLVKLQNEQIDLGGKEHAIANMLDPKLLEYNTDWGKIERMLQDALSSNFRMKMEDDFGGGWVYSWHCMDHMNYSVNPRRKDVGYGNIFNFYRNALAETNSNKDELNWHFHPVAFSGSPVSSATCFANSYSVLNEILCRRILEDKWFPVVNRPGFHAERSDSNLFLEQWIPFDFANQAYEKGEDQPDIMHGRFGDWRRAPATWSGYHPHHDDYQAPGSCRRMIFRCLNIGTRLRVLHLDHVSQAFSDARNNGQAVLAFADHDYRDIRPDVELVREMLQQTKREFPDVKIKFSGAQSAARQLLNMTNEPAPKLEISVVDNRLIVQLEKGRIFGPQPFLAMKTHDGRVFHDNLDEQEHGRQWSYTFDNNTIVLNSLHSVGVGSAGRYGGYSVACLEIG
jgi:hypothetical protein